ncbi:predicted protein [Nematostella vectensis]|uniref:G-protein coupled receptors family 1 profile domain-containing protein n=1 Tax=Nematostella vectensis TaxID=45351 RepID=A7S9X3_NEMVE|nr:substance-P receptor [Nematostella vectensis]EDO39498.1 predicted protein [Nematostella vectensis]|eukprot:XP_001631561.1 predicted protein [Nematostella vectensis]
MANNTTFYGNVSLASPVPWFIWYKTPEDHRLGLLSAYIGIVTLSLLGDIALIAVICKYRHLRTKGNYFVLNMAASDIAALLVLTRSVYILHSESNAWDIQGWPGDILCKLAAFTRDITISVSIQSMVFLALNRYVAVVYPARPPPVILRPQVAIPFIWVAGFATFGVYFRVYRIEVMYGEIYCFNRWEPPFDPSTGQRNFYIMFMITQFFIPLPLMTVIYIAIALNLKRQVIPGEQLPENERRQRKRNKNAVLMAAAIVGSFAVCWAPQHTFELLQWRGALSDLKFEEYVYIHNTVVVMTYASFVINPLICFMFTEGLRKALKQMLTCGCFLNSTWIEPSKTMETSLNLRTRQRHDETVNEDG